LGAPERASAQSIYLEPAIISFCGAALRCASPTKAAAKHRMHENAIKNLLEFVLAFFVARELENQFPATGMERRAEITVD
jgi:hypothetical protein